MLVLDEEMEKEMKKIKFSELKGYKNFINLLSKENSLIDNK